MIPGNKRCSGREEERMGKERQMNGKDFTPRAAAEHKKHAGVVEGKSFELRVSRVASVLIQFGSLLFSLTEQLLLSLSLSLSLCFALSFCFRRLGQHRRRNEEEAFQGPHSRASRLCL